MSQQALADAVGVGRFTISRAENGSCSNILGKRIAQALQVLPETLLYDEKNHAIPPDGLAVTPAERQVLVGLRDLDPLGKRMVLRLVSELAAGASHMAAVASVLSMLDPAAEKPAPPPPPAPLPDLPG
jgi:DNA-binding XRE family transcriptional regulator